MEYNTTTTSTPSIPKAPGTSSVVTFVGEPPQGPDPRMGFLAEKFEGLEKSSITEERGSGSGNLVDRMV